MKHIMYVLEVENASWESTGYILTCHKPDEGNYISVLVEPVDECIDLEHLFKE